MSLVVVAVAVGWLLMGLLASECVAADVLVGRFDARGTGANLSETVLTTATVNPSRFGKLFTYEVEGAVYAQPLVVSRIPVRGRLRNVVYVATTNNMVYALDADDVGPNGGLLWQVRLTEGSAFPAPSEKTSLTVQGNVGILSTPVIDRRRGALYVVARTLGSSGFRQRLHALDLATGRDKPRSPVDICVPACASVSRDGLTFTFDPRVQSNRPGLTLSESSVVIAWSGLDADHGWVMAYDADSLQRTGVFCTTCAKAAPVSCPCPTCEGPPARGLIGGGIWQSGRPPVVDSRGHIYYFVGNGWTMGYVGKQAWYTPACCPGQPKPIGYYGESLVKLAPRTLALVGSWTPGAWCDLERGDNDLGGSGPVLIDLPFPGGARTYAVGGGKDGRLYSVDTGSITGPDMVEGAPATALRGSFVVANTPAPCPPTHRAFPHHIMGGPVVWPRSSGAPRFYLSVENDCVRGFVFTNPMNGNPVTLTSRVIPGHPGAILSLSANGDRPGSGVLWMTYALDNPPVEGATFDTRRGRLAAHDAENLTRELWNSDMTPGRRDTLGYFAKFNPPSIANGKVYVAASPAPEPYRTTGEHTYQAPNSMGYLVVYGLNPPASPPVRSFVADALPSIVSPLLGD